MSATAKGLAPGEQAPSADQIHYNFPIAHLKVGDSIGTKGGSIFWLIFELRAGADGVTEYVLAHNQLAGRAHRVRRFESAPVAIIERR
jgi:hypothetical protein